jgi:hypothetical protein
VRGAWEPLSVVAAKAGASPAEVHRWVDEGRLCVLTDEAGGRWVRVVEVEQLIALGLDVAGRS